jgi:hypothetical protein
MTFQATLRKPVLQDNLELSDLRILRSQLKPRHLHRLPQPPCRFIHSSFATVDVGDNLQKLYALNRSFGIDAILG